MYIYIEGKEPVARKSKSLAEMGVQDGDNLIVTTEMKLPITVYSSDDTNNDGQAYPGGDNENFSNEDQPANQAAPAQQPNLAMQQAAHQRMLQQQALQQAQGKAMPGQTI